MKPIKAIHCYIEVIVFMTTLFMLGSVPGMCSDLMDNNVSKEYSPIVIDLINTMRSDPLGYAISIGLNADEVGRIFETAGLSHILQGMDPLNPDPILEDAAREHFNDMIENLYFSHYDLQGRTPGQRLASHGFHAIVWGEAMAGLAFSNVIDPGTALHLMFQELARSALLLDGEGTTLLDPNVTRVGVFFSGGGMLIAGEYYNVYLLVIETARHASQVTEGEIGGRVFIDQNNDGMFQLNEALPGCTIEFHGPIWTGFSPYVPGGTYVAYTSPTGTFYKELGPGEYEYVANCAGIGVQTGRVKIDASTILDIRFSIDGNSPSNEAEAWR